MGGTLQSGGSAPQAVEGTGSAWGGLWDTGDFLGLSQMQRLALNSGEPRKKTPKIDALGNNWKWRC